MNYTSSIAERAILSIDRFIDQAMTYAWTSTLERRCSGKELMTPLWRLQRAPEQEYGGGDLCSPRRKPSGDDHQPLE
jgi:hypothetical protein